MLKSKGAKIIDKILDFKYTLHIVIIIGIILGSLLAVYIIDHTPATQSDYKPLLEIQENLKKDFNNVYKYQDADVNITKDNISVYIDNKDCSLKIIFDRDTNYMYTEKNDKAVNWAVFTLGVITYSIATTGGMVIIFLFCMFGLQNFFEWLYKLTEKKRNKKNIHISGDIEH